MSYLVKHLLWPLHHQQIVLQENWEIRIKNNILKINSNKPHAVSTQDFQSTHPCCLAMSINLSMSVMNEGSFRPGKGHHSTANNPSLHYTTLHTPTHKHTFHFCCFFNCNCRTASKRMKRETRLHGAKICAKGWHASTCLRFGILDIRQVWPVTVRRLPILGNLLQLITSA